MTSSVPAVTVLIPTYDRKMFLGSAIDSVLAQSFADFELLIIDDGSTDGTADLLAAYDDARIRIVRNPVNQGSPKTRNLGLDLARGRYIAMLDSDDVADPERLTIQSRYLDQHRHCALVGSGKRPLDGPVRLGNRLRRRPTLPAEIHARLLFRCCIAHSTVMGRTEILRRYRYNEDFGVSQDYDLFVRLAEHFELANLEQPLVQVRRHAGQVSRRRDLVADRQKAILARQLDRLGIAWSAEELQRHFLLSRPGSWHKHRKADLVFAESWLPRLRDANLKTGRYPAPVLDRILSEAWLELCLKAMPASLISLPRWLWLSPLATATWAGLRERAVSLMMPARPS